MRKIITDIIFNALLHEVDTTPKPGLVDREGNGAHTDMNHETFIKSANALKPYFAKLYDVGFSYKGELPLLFTQVRKIGKRAESAMYKATKNVNTHKGILFTSGIIASLVGYHVANNIKLNYETLSKSASLMCSATLKKELEEMKTRTPITNGEIVYNLFHSPGVRQQVIEGFPILKEALAYYKIEVAKNLPQYLPEVKTLLTIMESNEDTNVLSRTKNYAALFYVNEKAKEALQALEENPQEGLSSVYDLDRDFIEKNISPGGSADLLALTFIFYDLEQL